MYPPFKAGKFNSLQSYDRLIPSPLHNGPPRLASRHPDALSSESTRRETTRANTHLWLTLVIKPKLTPRLSSSNPLKLIYRFNRIYVLIPLLIHTRQISRIGRSIHPIGIKYWTSDLHSTQLINWSPNSWNSIV